MGPNLPPVPPGAAQGPTSDKWGSNFGARERSTTDAKTTDEAKVTTLIEGNASHDSSIRCMSNKPGSQVMN